jgi:tRNA dimethylallyltransferase
MPEIIVITGPTASGKTRLAAEVAGKLNGEIISADSRQVYRGMNLGTGKDYDDYIVNGIKIPCHLIDILDPGEECNVFSYQQDFSRVCHDIVSRGKIPVLCGGTGLYIESVLAAYQMTDAPRDETLRAFLENKNQDELAAYLASLRPLHNTTDILERNRTIRAIEIATYEQEKQAEESENPTLKPMIFGVAWERKTQRERITQRLHERLGQGMVLEVETLIKQGVSPEKLDYYGLEYRYLPRYISGTITYE